MPEKELARLFGCDDASGEAELQKAIAARNIPAAAKLLENYEGNLDNVVYTVLQTMIEMEKILKKMPGGEDAPEENDEKQQEK